MRFEWLSTDYIVTFFFLTAKLTSAKLQPTADYKFDMHHLIEFICKKIENIADKGGKKERISTTVLIFFLWKS